jgi:hypothetical protein
MVTLEQIEAARQPRLGAAERGKILEVLDLVMAVHGGDQPM